MRRLLVVAVCLGATACNGETATSGCSGNKDCNAGFVCVQDGCTKLCSSDLHCEADEICIDSVCKVGSRSGGPQIDTVDGDGSPDIDPMQAAHHFGDALIISGKNLIGVSVELVGAQSFTLDVNTTSTDTLLTALLPPNLVDGSYTLHVSNQVGADQTGVTILQGEPGPTGSDANMTGTEIVTRLNDAGASGTISAARLPPALNATRMTTIKVVASGAAGGNRSVVLSGVNVSLGTGDGVQLVVIDLTTHTVRSDTSITGPPFLHNFQMIQPLDGQNLASVLNELDDTNAVILATRGDAFDQLEYWIAAAASLGASLRLSTVQNGDGYILIGRPGLGEGNGIEAVVDGTSGDTRVVTVLLDDEFLGRRDRRKRNAVYSKGNGTNIDCNASAGTWRPWAPMDSVLPPVTLVTTGGLVNVRFNGWTHTWDSSQVRFQVELNDGTTAYTSGQCARAYTNGNIHATSTCDVIMENIPAGRYTVRVNWECYDSGTATTLDARVYCGTPDSCTLFAEEL